MFVFIILKVFFSASFTVSFTAYILLKSFQMFLLIGFMSFLSNFLVLLTFIRFILRLF